MRKEERVEAQAHLPPSSLLLPLPGNDQPTTPQCIDLELSTEVTSSSSVLTTRRLLRRLFTLGKVSSSSSSPPSPSSPPFSSCLRLPLSLKLTASSLSLRFHRLPASRRRHQREERCSLDRAGSFEGELELSSPPSSITFVPFHRQRELIRSCSIHFLGHCDISSLPGRQVLPSSPEGDLRARWKGSSRRGRQVSLLSSFVHSLSGSEADSSLDIWIQLSKARRSMDRGDEQVAGSDGFGRDEGFVLSLFVFFSHSCLSRGHADFLLASTRFRSNRDPRHALRVLQVRFLRLLIPPFLSPSGLLR